MTKEEFAVAAITLLVGVFFTSLIPRKLKERQNFINAASEFRKAINKAIVATESTADTTSNDIRDVVRCAYLDFRHHLRGKRQQKYDEAWNIYCLSNGSDREDESIEYLLRFTEHRISKLISFWAEDLLFVFRFKVFGPDEKTNKLINNICEHKDIHNK